MKKMMMMAALLTICLMVTSTTYGYVDVLVHEGYPLRSDGGCTMNNTDTCAITIFDKEGPPSPENRFHIWIPESQSNFEIGKGYINAVLLEPIVKDKMIKYSVDHETIQVLKYSEWLLQSGQSNLRRD